MIFSFRQLRTAAPPYRASWHENVNSISNVQGRARAARECRKRDRVAHIEAASGEAATNMASAFEALNLMAGCVDEHPSRPVASS